MLVMEISSWLRGLGLEDYAQAFQANHIDAEVLPRLTADDLTALGITSVGHRRRLLDAITLLQNDAAPASAQPAALTTHPSQAERRQLTVLFCDLVGSTTLAARLDPEDMGQVIRTYHGICTQVVERWGGQVAKYMGDGVLAYFGWPQAHEDEAERAVRAGLALTEAVGKVVAPAGKPLAARVGIATGLVMVGELIGQGQSQEQTVVGETPNLAARLQALAVPGSVVISQATRRLVGELFELVDLGPRRLKGFAEPLSVWRVEGEGRAEGRFEALHGEHLTPLIGREHELGMLLQRWDWARDGDGQAVLLSGEPGIGKSRMLRALRERLGDEPHTPISHYCSPHHTASAFYPVIDLLERLARLDRSASPEVQLARLEAVLAGAGQRLDEVMPLFAALLGVPTGAHYPALTVTPEVQKRRTLQALLDELAGLAARQPVLALYEDVHWIDPSTLELLGMVIERIRQLPVLVVITFRPEFQPPWSGHAHVTALTMNRLGRRQGADLVAGVAGDKPLPAAIVEQIVARTDGVPLFVEELTKTVLESDLLTDVGDHYEPSGSLPSLAIPTTLHDSLMARLDRLAPLKEVAQIGAVIGREFSHDLLAAVAPISANQLGDALEQLVTSELVFRRGAPPDAIYTFKHALVQDAAYQSLLRSKRQQLHARIAQVLEERFPEITARQPEWLAHHYTEALLGGRASSYWLEAARRAKAAYALREASTHLDKCLEVMASAPAPDGDAHAAKLCAQRLEALVLLGDVASLMGDLESSNRHYERALSLTSEPDIRARIANKRHQPSVAVRNGARIVFYEHGGGPDTLLLVSPLAYGLATIQPVLERLCQEFRIITVDPRGSGASDALTRPYPLDEHLKDVRAVIAALGDQPVVGIGVSASANLLLKLAHAEPRLFTKLVTIGALTGSYSRPFDPRYLDKNAGLENEDVAHLIRSHTEMVFSEPEMRELRELTIRSRLLLPRETILSFFDPDPGKNVMPLLADIRCPCLIIHGREDRLVAFSAAEQIAAGLPNAQLYPFEGKGHLPIFSATDEFCEVLSRFVRTGSTPP
jgi:class 3 adenylate cyclase/pimeloyl-ACP methyl ester carboxylesterase